MKKRYTLKHRRRREGKTNYKKRLRMLMGGKKRVVIRKSNQNMIIQLIEFHPEGDKVIVSATSNELKKLGWRYSGNNIPAAYLIGKIFGKKALKKKEQKGILDAGLYNSTKGSKIYAALKGVVDSGFEIPHSEEIIPDMKRITGEPIKKHAENLKSDKKEYEKQFSKYLKNKVLPEKITEEFEKINKKIDSM